MTATLSAPSATAEEPVRYNGFGVVAAILTSCLGVVGVWAGTAGAQTQTKPNVASRSLMDVLGMSDMLWSQRSSKGPCKNNFGFRLFFR